MPARRLVLPALALAIAAAVLALLGNAARAAARQEVAIASADGTRLSATLTVPSGEQPPGGWPAVVFMHGIGGTRAQALSLAQAMGMVGEQYAALAFDARGHGTSAGLVGLDGPNEIADVRAVFNWLRDRPDVSDTRIGAFGISYGGGAAWNSLAAGVPWSVVETCIAFTDLARALVPQGLAKSGVIAGFVTALDPARVDPAVTAARDAALAGRTAAVRAFSAPRSSLPALAGVRTPVFVMQGRRDFVFGLDQALPAWSALAGPKKLWIGNVGHIASGFPGPDTGAMLASGKRWFDRYLLDERGRIDASAPVTIAAEDGSRLASSAGLPATRPERGSSRQARSIATPSGRATWSFGPVRRRLEVFGAPQVKVTATASGGWSRIVAVLSAVSASGTRAIAAGGVPARKGKATYTIGLTSQVTVVPRAARLVLGVAASSSTATSDPVGLVYLDLPMPATSRLSVADVSFTLPVLVEPVSG